MPDPSRILDESGNPIGRVKDVFLLFLQTLFLLREPGNLHWCEEVDQTEILITDNSPIKYGDQNFVPVIQLHTSPFGWMDTSMDNLSGVDERTGERHHIGGMNGMFTFNCIEAKGIPAHNLAWFIWSRIKYFEREIAALAHAAGVIIHIGKGGTIGNEMPPGSMIPHAPEEAVAVPVSYTLVIFHEWKVKPAETLAVKKLIVRLTVEQQRLVRHPHDPVRPKKGYAGEGVTALTSPAIEPTTVTPTVQHTLWVSDKE